MPPIPAGLSLPEAGVEPAPKHFTALVLRGFGQKVEMAVISGPGTPPILNHFPGQQPELLPGDLETHCRFPPDQLDADVCFILSLIFLFSFSFKLYFFFLLGSSLASSLCSLAFFPPCFLLEPRSISLRLAK